MPKINENYLNLKESYLFSEIAHRVDEYKKNNPDKDVIRLGIGDVTKPLSPSVVSALHEAADQMGKAESFKGYGPEKGYEFLRKAISEYYKRNNVNVNPDEIFISDGAKSDTGNVTVLIYSSYVCVARSPCYLRSLQRGWLVQKIQFSALANTDRNLCLLDANARVSFLFWFTACQSY